MEEAEIGIVRFVFMGVDVQRRDVTAVAIAVNHTTIDKGIVGKFFHGHLLDIGYRLHFQKAGIDLFIQRQCHENFRLFCVSGTLFPCCRAAKVCIIKFDDAAQLMGFIPLPHGSAYTLEYKPSSFLSLPSIAAS